MKNINKFLDEKSPEEVKETARKYLISFVDAIQAALIKINDEAKEGTITSISRADYAFARKDLREINLWNEDYETMYGYALEGALSANKLIEIRDRYLK